MYGYVFDVKCWPIVSAILNETRMRKFESVVSCFVQT